MPLPPNYRTGWIVLIVCRLTDTAGDPVVDYIATETVLGTDVSGDLAFYEGVIRGQVERGTDVSVATQGGRDAVTTISRIEIADIEGSRSAWRSYSIDGLLWEVYLLQRGKPFSAKRLWFKALGKGLPSVVNATTLGIALTDRSHMLDVPLQSSVYPSSISNVSLRGRPKPLVLGQVYQAPCVQPETTDNVVCDVTDAAYGGVLRVYDNGVTRDPVTQWRTDTDAARYGFELLTARGGRLAANVQGNVSIDATDLLSGDGNFSSLAGWTTDTTAGTVTRGWDPADASSNITFSSSNRVATHSGGLFAACRGDRTLSSGLWYWEVQCAGAVTSSVGVSQPDTALPPTLGYDTTSWGWNQTGEVRNAGAVVASGYAWTAGQRLGLALNLTTGKLWLRIAGTWANGDPVAGTGGVPVTGPFRPALGLSSSDSATLYPSAATVAAAAPTGFSYIEDASTAGSATLVSGKLRLQSNGGNQASASHGGMTVGNDYYWSLDLTDVTAGVLEVVSGTEVLAQLSAAGSWAGAYTATSPSITLRRRAGAPTDLRIDNVEVRAATLTDRLAGFVGYVTGRLGLSSYVDASVAALQTAQNYRIGDVPAAGRTGRQVLQAALDSWLGWCAFTPADQLSVGRLVAPSGSPDLTITELNLAAPIESVFDEARGLSDVILAARNHEVFQESELPSGLAASERAVVTAKWRVRIVSDAVNTSIYATRNSGTTVRDRSRTDEEGMPTTLVDPDDAEYETQRRWGTLYHVPRAFHPVVCAVDPAELDDYLDTWLGAFIHVRNARQPEFAAGIDLIVLGRREQFPAGVITFKGWG